MKLSPTQIAPYNATEMLVTWNTDEKYAVPYVELRYYCPCAGCVDEHTGERTIQRTHVSPDIRATDVQLVGRYAVQIYWSDNHSTGIYHYDRLHEICRKQGRPLAQ